MKRKKLLGLLIAGSVIYCAAFPPFAFAYLDPGTGSYIFQLIIAGLVGGLFALKLFWRQIRNFFARIFSRKDTDDRANG